MKFYRIYLISLLTVIAGTSACKDPTTPTPGTGPSPTPAALAETSPAESPSPTPTEVPTIMPLEFSDVTSEVGIRFRHNNGAYGKKYLPETTGAGCAFLDFDNDGWQDILLINSTSFDDDPKKRRSIMALYRNDRSGSFINVTSRAGLARSMYGMGVSIGDYDNDGWVDIFITALGTNRLYRNLKNGKFADVTAQTGVGGKPEEFSTSAAWFDYNKDGKLDLFVCNYVDWSIDKDLNCTLDGTNKSYCTPESYNGQTSRLYRNTGGKFEDVTKRAGILDPTGKALGVAITDYNSDGWPDVFVANDTQPNKLYSNNGDGTFVESAIIAGVAFSEEGKARAGMGVDFADYDGSGYPSLIIGNFSNETLGVYHNEGNTGLFIDEAPSTAIGKSTLLTLTFGLFFFDYDLDGKLDIFLANGHVADDINKVQPKITYAQRPQLFRNLGSKRFTEVSRKMGAPFRRPIVARGAAYGDYDNDGDQDILVVTNGGPAYLFRNEGGNQNNFVRFKTIGTTSNRDGIGAKITISTQGAGKQWQVVHTGSSYCSQSELPLTFGINQATKIDRVMVEWPSGKVDRLSNLASNQLYLIREGSGVQEALPLPLPTPSP